jgi:hypothetical protein
MESHRVAFRDQLAGSHTVLVVVHVTSGEQALRNSQIAQEAGADGVFLINHGIDTASLKATWSAVTTAMPRFWVGVNDLTTPAIETARSWQAGLAGVWEDHTVMARDLPYLTSARTRAVQWAALDTPPLLFGGVAFKYGPDESLTGDRLAALASAATQFVDVVTTSGPGTGYSARLTKIATIRAAIGDSPLAIASGITAENVADYLPYADCFLVASGISRSFDELDPTAVSALVARVRRG